MRKHIQLNIPTPCHENWDKMMSAEQGKFCNSCQKQVIDFTNMGDAQLVAYFRKRTTGSVCGRFMQDQLDRRLEIPKKRIPWVKYFFQFALPAFLASTKAASQGEVRLLTGEPVLMASSNTNVTKDVIAKRIGKRIKGIIADESGNGIPYASVFIKGTTIGAATDSTGSFILEYRGRGDSIVVIGSSVGYQAAEIVLILNQSEAPVVITLNTMHTLEEVVVAGAIQIKGGVVSGATSIVTTANIFDVIHDKFFPVKQSFKLYPNPVRRNSSLTIDIKNSDEGSHLFQVLTISGQVIIMKEFWIDKYNSVFTLNISSMAAGTYFLRMVNKQSGKNITEKITVE